VCYIRALPTEVSVNKCRRLLRRSLFAGSAYFLAVAIAHQIGAKVPGSYVYFGLPSRRYQDCIISVLCLGWAVFLFIGFLDLQQNPTLVWGIIVSGWAAILGLVRINTLSDLRAVSAVTELTVCWIETGVLASYALWITLLAIKSRREIHAQR
jgi:hypothetical protein